MKIEISPLDAKILLPYLRDDAQHDIQIERFAVGAVGRLIAGLENVIAQAKLK